MKSHSILKTFRTCGRWLTDISLSLLAGVSIGTNVDYNLIRSQPASPLSMAGFPEDNSRGFLFSMRRIQEYIEWKSYRADKADLANKLAECTSAPDTCPARIKYFAELIELVKKIPDRKAQAEAINAFMNATIRYDHKEANANLPHRSMVEALLDGTGVCDEQARLKLAALELAGFSEDDIRYVAVYWLEPRKPIAYHAVVEVRIDGKNWILNNQSIGSKKFGAIIDRSVALRVFDLNSIIERDVIAVNGQKSHLLNQNTILIPMVSFNFNEAAFFHTSADKYTVSTKIPAARPVNIEYANASSSLGPALQDSHIKLVMTLAYSLNGIDVEDTSKEISTRYMPAKPRLPARYLQRRARTYHRHRMAYRHR